MVGVMVWAWCVWVYGERNVWSWHVWVYGECNVWSWHVGVYGECNGVGMVCMGLW